MILWRIDALGRTEVTDERTTNRILQWKELYENCSIAPSVRNLNLDRNTPNRGGVTTVQRWSRAAFTLQIASLTACARDPSVQ